MFEITFVDTGKTVRWSTAKAHKFFGREEFAEIKAGYLPHIVAVRVN